MSNLVSTVQAAKILDYHPQTVRDLARRGILPGIKRRQKWFFKPEQLKEFYQQNAAPVYEQNQIGDLD